MASSSMVRRQGYAIPPDHTVFAEVCHVDLGGQIPIDRVWVRSTGVGRGSARYYQSRASGPRPGFVGGAAGVSSAHRGKPIGARYLLEDHLQLIKCSNASLKEQESS
ncbi:hypothetical protein R1flu_012236 [Riccia fluitans]|uniref:Uncharacterized protein n=1 Tax=Riccia fluitans TaxID=41844 RepID=A0ABD1ZB71_9MARC